MNAVVLRRQVVGLVGLEELSTLELRVRRLLVWKRSFVISFFLFVPLRTLLSAAAVLFAWCRMFWLAALPLGFCGLRELFRRATWRCLRQAFPKESVDGGWRRDEAERQSEEGLSLEMFALRLFFCCEGGE